MHARGARERNGRRHARLARQRRARRGVDGDGARAQVQDAGARAASRSPSPSLSRETATRVDAGERGSQQRSRMGTTQATNASGRRPPEHPRQRRERPAAAGRHGAAPARASAGPVAAQRARDALGVPDARRKAEEPPRLGDSRSEMGSVITSSFSWLTGGSRDANATPRYAATSTTVATARASAEGTRALGQRLAHGARDERGELGERDRLGPREDEVVVLRRGVRRGEPEPLDDVVDVRVVQHVVAGADHPIHRGSDHRRHLVEHAISIAGAVDDRRANDGELDPELAGGAPGEHLGLDLGGRVEGAGRVRVLFYDGEPWQGTRRRRRSSRARSGAPRPPRRRASCARRGRRWTRGTSARPRRAGGERRPRAPARRPRRARDGVGQRPPRAGAGAGRREPVDRADERQHARAACLEPPHEVRAQEPPRAGDRRAADEARHRGRYSRPPPRRARGTAGGAGTRGATMPPSPFPPPPPSQSAPARAGAAPRSSSRSASRSSGRCWPSRSRRSRARCTRPGSSSRSTGCGASGSRRSRTPSSIRCRRPSRRARR